MINVYDSLGEKYRLLREEGRLKVDSSTGKINDSEGEELRHHTFYGK